MKIKTNEIITQKQLENGIWQFILDHSYPYEKELRHVRFQVKNKNELMRRIYSRATGIYKIKNESKIEKEMHKYVQFYASLKTNHLKYQETGNRINNLPRVKKFIVVGLNKIRKKLIERWCYSTQNKHEKI